MTAYMHHAIHSSPLLSMGSTCNLRIGTLFLFYFSSYVILLRVQFLLLSRPVFFFPSIVLWINPIHSKPHESVKHGTWFFARAVRLLAGFVGCAVFMV